MPSTRTTARRPVRKPLPAHLPREVATHQPAVVCPECGGSGWATWALAKQAMQQRVILVRNLLDTMHNRELV